MKYHLAKKLREHYDTKLAPMLKGERSAFNIERVMHEGAGSWDYDPHAKKHEITLDESFMTTNAKGGSNLGYGRAIMRHEVAHALYTERDASKRLALGDPYIANLLEDARIEHKARREQKRAFGWKNYQSYACESGFTDPSSILLDMITAEGMGREMQKVKDACAMAGASPTYDAVLRAFNAARKAESTTELADLVEKWGKKFGKAPSPHAGSSHGASASSAASGGSGSGGMGSGGGSAGAPSMGSGTASGGTPAKGGGGGSAHYVPPPMPSARSGKVSGNHYSSGGGSWKFDPANEAKAKLCMSRLMDAFKTGDQVRYTQAPKGRLSMRHVIGSLPSIFRGVKHTGNDSPMNVRVIIDTSGSMGCTMAQELGAFVEALFMMHEKGMMKIDLWLSGDGSCSHIPDPKKADAFHITSSGGCESIHHTMVKSNKWKSAKEYDAVLIITDGQITDGSVERSHFSGQDNTFCCYVPVPAPCSPSIINRMKEQFPRAIFRNTAESLSTHVAGALASMRASGQFARQV